MQTEQSTKEPVFVSSQTQIPTQNVVYVEKKSKSKWLYCFIFLIILLICACICIVPSVMIMRFSSDIETSISESTSAYKNNIKENDLLTISDNNATENAKIAVINISGVISYSMPGGANVSGAQSGQVISELQKANTDDSVKAVLLRMNTPGGEVVAAEPICREIMNVNKKKPVYTFIDSMGASLGYLLPNCSKYIYSRPESMTGSIGVVLQAVDVYGVLEKFGGKVVFVTNSKGSQKTGQEIFDKNSETYKIYQQMLDETYEYFVQKVYDGRKETKNLTKEQIKTLADGRVYTGQQAYTLGLVDQLGQFEDVINSIISKENLTKYKVTVTEYYSPVDFLSRFFMKNVINTDNIDEIIKEQNGIKLLMQSGLVPN